MFEIQCAFTEAGGAARYLAPGETPGGHEAFCSLRVYFSVTEIFPPEPLTGAELDWLGDIEAIETRTCGAGDRFRRYRRLQGEELEAARRFLLQHHGKALWDAGGTYAEQVYLEDREAAA
jgi:hypothetical protein